MIGWAHAERIRPPAAGSGHADSRMACTQELGTLERWARRGTNRPSGGRWRRHSGPLGRRIASSVPGASSESFSCRRATAVRSGRLSLAVLAWSSPTTVYLQFTDARPGAPSGLEAPASTEPSRASERSCGTSRLRRSTAAAFGQLGCRCLDASGSLALSSFPNGRGASRVDVLVCASDSVPTS